MSLLVMLILGAVVGWAAASVMGRREGIIGSMVIGVVGAVIGGFLSTLIAGGDRAALAFSWSGLIWSFVGAVILVGILNAMSSPRHHQI